MLAPTAKPTTYSVPIPASAPEPTQLVHVVKNYVIHETDQFDGVPTPDWWSTMNALFGTHADWMNIKVHTGKHRPLSMLYCFLHVELSDMYCRSLY